MFAKDFITGLILMAVIFLMLITVLDQKQIKNKLKFKIMKKEDKNKSTISIITRYEFSMDISDFGMSYIGEIEKVSKDKIFINKGDYELLVMDYYFKSVRPYNLVIEGLEYKRVSCE